ncbi:hypothetical protein MMC18_007725 [Xylographa bjoerkii]|nr:hypothetical protein [Xylographa bjoerkii]
MELCTASGAMSSKQVEIWRHDVPGLENSHGPTVNAARRPPPYSTVSQSNQSDESTHLCCAYFDWGIGDVAEFTGLLTQSRRLQFLYWVAIHRSRAQEIPTLERLSCPLLWCRTSFDGHEKLVDHVSTCPHLDQGEYWCPYHQQAEHFAQPMFDRLSGNVSQSSRRPSWKGAVKAIRKLGSKGLQKAIHPSRSRRSQNHDWQEQNFETNKGNQGDILELMSEAKLPELDGQGPVQSAPISTTIYEAAGAYLPFEMEDTCNHAAELESETLSCPSMDWESTGNTTPESSLSPVSPISPGDQWHRQIIESLDSPISPADLSYTVPWASDETRLTKHAATTPVKQSPSASCWLPVSGSKECMVDLKSIHIDTSCTDTTVFMWSNEVTRDERSHTSIHQIAATQAPTYEDDSNAAIGASGSLHRSVSSILAEDVTVPSPVRHVEDLRDIFHNLFDETMHKLNRPPTSHQAMTLVSLRPSATFLLRHGFAALRKHLNNENKLSFWEVFGLSHLAYASAILSNPVDLKEEFRKVFIDIMRLSSHIICVEDKVAFMQLAHELWLPESYPAGSITSSNEALLHMSAGAMQISSEPMSFATLTLLATAHPSIDTSTYVNEASIHNSEGGLLEWPESRGSMTSCRAVRHCLQTLESFEHAEGESRKSLATTAKVMEVPYLITPKDTRRNRAMRQYITEPLIQEIGFEGFIPIITDADRLLRDTNKVGLRELELKLLNDSKYCAKSQVLYDRFTKLVMCLCDRASMIIGGESRTREEHYLQDIDHILCIYRGLPQRKPKQPEYDEDQNQDLTTRASRNSPTVIEGPRPEGLQVSSNETHCCRPIEPTFVDGSPTVGSSGFHHSGMTDQYDRTLDLPELDSDSQTEHIDNVPTPEAESSASTRDQIVQAGEPSEGSLTCLQCDKVFRGKLVWLQSNLQRHMREKHSEAKKFICPGCGKSFSRKHNLKVHVEAVHGRTRGW